MTARERSGDGRPVEGAVDAAVGDRSYQPRPIDTTGVTLPTSLSGLIERLAENNHEVWAAARMAEGWRRGPARDDERYEHPLLMRYHQLSEAEKDYDRATVEETLKALVALGGRIEGPPSEPAPSAGGLGPHRQLCEMLLASGDALAAFDVAEAGLEHQRGDLRLRQLRGLALARSGALQSALEALSSLCEEGHRDGETCAILAGRQKQLALRSRDPARRRHWAALARATYETAHRLARTSSALSEAYYAGINAAALALLCDDPSRANSLAEEVSELCRRSLHLADGRERYWVRATIAESFLIRQAWSEARHWYANAAEVATEHRWFADLATTRRQVLWLLQLLGREDPSLLTSLALPRVVAFSGRLAGSPGRREPAPPLGGWEHWIEKALRDRLERLNAGFGYCAGACSADILFAEALLERQGTLQIVLPCPPEQVRARSADLAPGSAWERRFERILEKAAGVRVASPSVAPGSDAAYQYLTLFLAGLATLGARQLGAELVPLTIWNGEPDPQPASTSQFVDHWRARGTPVETIHGATAGGGAPASKEHLALDSRLGSAAPSQSIRAILFADVVGYSRLSEEEIPSFVQEFLGRIAGLLHQLAPRPVHAATWGDAIYVVFESVGQAAAFALDMRDAIVTGEASDESSPRGLNVRISLHVGPVYEIKDPITGTRAYTGAHVTRTARIEPVVPPGEVYATEPFAALAASSRATGVEFDYVGRTVLAKKYGSLPLYHVRRSEWA